MIILPSGGWRAGANANELKKSIAFNLIMASQAQGLFVMQDQKTIDAPNSGCDFSILDDKMTRILINSNHAWFTSVQKTATTGRYDAYNLLERAAVEKYLSKQNKCK